MSVENEEVLPGESGHSKVLCSKCVDKKGDGSRRDFFGGRRDS